MDSIDIADIAFSLAAAADLSPAPANKVINNVIIENMEELSIVQSSLCDASRIPENGHMYDNIIKDIIKRNMSHLDRKWLKIKGWIIMLK
jgi:hypothetical protein